MTVANDWLWVVFDNLHALGKHDATSRTAAPCHLTTHSHHPRT